MRQANKDNSKKPKLPEAEKAVGDIKRLLKKTHRIEQKFEFYDGYKGSDQTGDTVPLRELLGKEHFEFCTEGNGSLEPMLHHILWALYRMGYEKGQSRERERIQPLLDTLAGMVAVVRGAV